MPTTLEHVKSIYDLDSEPSARVSLSCKTKLLNNVRDALVEQSSPTTPGKSYTFGRRVRVEICSTLFVNGVRRSMSVFRHIII